MSWGDIDSRVSRIESEMWRKADSYKVDDLRSEIHSLTRDLAHANGEIGYLREMLEKIQRSVSTLEEKEQEREHKKIEQERGMPA